MNKDVVHIYNGMPLSYIKKRMKKCSSIFAAFAAIQMQLEIITLSEVNKKEKDKYHTISLVCGIQTMTQMNLSMKQKHRQREEAGACHGEGTGRGMRLGLADTSFHLHNR